MNICKMPAVKIVVINSRVDAEPESTIKKGINVSKKQIIEAKI